MANLNETDLLVTNITKFQNLKMVLESLYSFKIQKTHYPSSISLTSKKAILETNKGKFFLKEKPQYCSEDILIQKSSLFQDFCSQNTAHVPKIIKTVEGNYYFEFENRKFFLSEYIDGKPFSGSKDDVKKMLDVLYSLNMVGEKFLMNKSLPKGISRRFESYEIATLIPFLVKYAKTDEDKSIFHNIEEVLALLQAEYSSIGNNDYIMAHSDCILFNYIFTKDQTYLIDFDNAKVLPRIHDLAEFFVSATMLNYLAEITNLKKPVFIKPDKHFQDMVLDYYRNNFKLSVKEKLLFPIIVDIVWLWTLCLSVLKDDYALIDLKDVLEKIKNKSNRKEITKLLNS
jgi:thiamine kinase-like enzyme